MEGIEEELGHLYWYEQRCPHRGRRGPRVATVVLKGNQTQLGLAGAQGTNELVEDDAP